MLTLSDSLAGDILNFLNVRPAAPDLALLDRLMASYIRTVSWESASRIARRAAIPDTAACPRWPEQFWDEAMNRGTGGTCFETNYAFFSLLRALGYDGYLTINNMHEYIGCHTAMVLNIGGHKWLADAGYPVHQPLPLADTPTERDGQFHHYFIQPDGNSYVISRSLHPQPYCFTVIDTPIAEADYRAATTADYGPNGLFLDRLVLNKIVGEQMWRFDYPATPSHLTRFENGQRIDEPVEGDVPAEVASKFGVDEAIICAAFTALDKH